MAKPVNIVSFDDIRARARGGSAAAGEAPRRGFADEGQRLERAYATALSARERRQRAHTKARADKMFSRQFPMGSSEEPSAENAPRPALYEGKMGSTHRKSARMQRASSAGPVSAKLNPSGWFSSLPVTPRALKVAAVALCLICAYGFLYGPAQQYYQAQRENERLSMEYSAIEQRNEALDVQNDILVSDAGMEDVVRQKYGYVKSGEQTAVVTGLSENATDTSRGSENIEANVLSSSVKAPKEWYTPLLDAFFGVE